MFINLLALAHSCKSIDTVASCQYCGIIWAMTEDEIQYFENQKSDYTIRGFICPECGQQLILPPIEKN